MNHTFFATLSRMKYIDRWALMRNSRRENLSEHCLEVAMIAHALCTIGNVRYGHAMEAEKAALIGIYHDASEIITGDMVTHSKPHPEIFLLACEKIGVKPENAYAIEDSYNGIRSANAGGLRPIMVPDLRPADDEMKELAEVVLKSLDEVVKYFDE